MIRIMRELQTDTDTTRYTEYTGLSTDSKPTNCGENSLFYELNTKKVFYFDGTTWKEIGA